MGQNFRDFFRTPHTIHIRRPTSVDDGGEVLAFSTPTPIKAHWEKDVNQVETGGQREEVTRHFLVFDGETTLLDFTGADAEPKEGDYLWLPGEDETDFDLGQRIQLIALFFEDPDLAELGGEAEDVKDHFEITL